MMKLKDTFLIHDNGEEKILVDASGQFSGLARANTTTAFILKCLCSDTSEAEIVDCMCEKYDAPREKIARDVHGILEKLSAMGALESL